LFALGRVAPAVLAAGGVDLVFAVAFAAAYRATRS